MEKLTNIIEAVLFASGKSVPIADISEKLGVTNGEVKKALQELQKKYGEEEGIRLLLFNNKAQLSTNPLYKEGVAAVLNPIREKELTRTILECAAIIAYKQPITKTEIEMLRGTNSDYAVRALLELQLIVPVGRKDAVGKPILYGTTDEFLKRFKLESLNDLPDYDALMAAITRTVDDDQSKNLYDRAEYAELPAEGSKNADTEQGTSGTPAAENAETGEKTGSEEQSDYDIPDFLRGLDDTDIVRIG